MNQMRKVIGLSVGSLATVGLLGVTSVFAATTPTLITSLNNKTTSTATITGGGLGIYSFTNTPVTFSALTLDGDSQTTSTNLAPLGVVDATGTGEGWNLSVSATQLTETLPSGGNDPLTLPLGSLTISAPTVAASYTVNSTDVVTTSQAPTITPSPAAIDNGSAVKLADAQSTNGMGAYLFTFLPNALTLAVAPSTITEDTTNYKNAATPFSTTITWTVTSGP